MDFISYSFNLRNLIAISIKYIIVAIFNYDRSISSVELSFHESIISRELIISRWFAIESIRVLAFECNLFYTVTIFLEISIIILIRDHDLTDDGEELRDHLRSMSIERMLRPRVRCHVLMTEQQKSWLLQFSKCRNFGEKLNQRHEINGNLFFFRASYSITYILIIY